ncbi:hypothetical protein Desaci_4312 [Desulfosporosinus acidiphilus SJ4]|uniref:Uncharacterized protein n=1 Tax=Desulfosporosinus acidiphilus (strain DSM 22704 / JCM 16185 / SJ4) TaxID=646529 RepID=I4DBI9_DESAJ|nr:hypothetical protein [Desulfosporosinus acidiphilus]AFM43163.1 hypothetical protein Desaci_4312 [Desulfosporosinus acidiphilus SJ4]
MFKTIRNSLVVVLIFLLISSTNVFALPLSHGWPDPLSTQIVGDRLVMSSPTTGTFHYKLFGVHGIDITSEVPASDLTVDARISTDGWENGGGRAAASLDPLTGTCTLTYNFSEADKYIKIFLTPRYCSGDSKTLIIGNSDADSLKRVDGIHFLSDSLTKTGPNTATFKYQIINFINDITQEIPASEIEAFSSIDSSVDLDPSTGTGIITFNTSETNQLIRTTLRDKRTGITAVLNTLGLDPVPDPVQTTTSSAISAESTTESTTDSAISVNSADESTTGSAITADSTTESTTDSAISVNSTPDPVQSTTASAIYRISFVSGDLTKTGTDTATFQYKILDHNYMDITKAVPATDLNVTALTSTTKAAVSLDPSTGIGTITYDFSKSDPQILVSLRHEKGIGVSALLNLASSESDNTIGSNTDDLKIAQISFIPTDMITFKSYAQLQYQILNKEGTDITSKVSASQLVLSSSVNSMISLQPKDRTCTITYNLNDSDKTIIVSITDKETGVKTALNIGNMPADLK